MLHLLGDDGESVGQLLTTNIANFFGALIRAWELVKYSENRSADIRPLF